MLGYPFCLPFSCVLKKVHRLSARSPSSSLLAAGGHDADIISVAAAAKHSNLRMAARMLSGLGTMLLRLARHLRRTLPCADHSDHTVLPPVRMP